MTSRTTKQAARAYQKAHDVPYAEALRAVMDGHHPQHVDPDPRRYAVPLGFTEVDHGPVEWVPFAALDYGFGPALGVYGTSDVDKTAFLAATAHELADRTPVLVVTSEPEHYPAPREGLQLFTPDDPQMSGAVEELVHGHSPDTLPMVIFDRNANGGPLGSRLLRGLLPLCRSHMVAVIFVAAHDAATAHRAHSWASMHHAMLVLNARADQSARGSASLSPDTPWTYPYNWVHMRGRDPLPLTLPPEGTKQEVGWQHRELPGEAPEQSEPSQGETAVPQLTRLNLGVHATPRQSGLVSSDERVPITWDIPADKPAMLGVYGSFGVGKTVYLATLVRDNLVGVPTLLVTAHPENYPEQGGLVVYPRPAAQLPTTDGERPASPEAVVEVAAREGRVLVYDDGPYDSEPDELDELATLAYKRGVSVLFTCLDETPSPGRASVDVVISRAARDGWTPTPARGGMPPNEYWVTMLNREPVQVAFGSEPFIAPRLLTSRQ